MGHRLHTVTNSQDRNSHIQNRPVTLRGSRLIDTRRTSRENDSPGIKGFDLCWRNIERMDFTIDVQLSDATCDELGILGAEINDDYSMVFNIHEAAFGNACARASDAQWGGPS